MDGYIPCIELPISRAFTLQTHVHPVQHTDKDTCLSGFLTRFVVVWVSYLFDNFGAFFVIELKLSYGLINRHPSDLIGSDKAVMKFMPTIDLIDWLTDCKR